MKNPNDCFWSRFQYKISSRERLIDGICCLQKWLSIIQLDRSVEVHLLHLCISYKRFTFYKPPEFSRYPSDEELVRRMLGCMQWPNPASRLIKEKKRKRKRKKLMISRNKVRPSQEKVNVMIAFYKILTVPRKRQLASNELLPTEGPYGIEFSLNALMPNIRFKQMPFTVSLDSLIFCWRRDSGENLSQKEGSSSQLRKTLTLSKKRSRMLWLSRIDRGDLGEPNGFK